jgi:hypothetical protein
MPRFQEGACGPITFSCSTNAPGAELEIVFSKSSCINRIWVAHAEDED